MNIDLNARPPSADLRVGHSRPERPEPSPRAELGQQAAELLDPRRPVAVSGAFPAAQYFKRVTVVFAERLKFLIHPHALADPVPLLRQLVENMVRLICHDSAFCHGAANRCAAPYGLDRSLTPSHA